MVTYTAKSLKEIAEQFKKRAEHHQALAEGREGYLNARDRKVAGDMASVWWNAATILFNITLEGEANGQQN